ncbi:hypothetical protein IFM89_036102 [Coptis chinensis]|uniref:Uncharacterized protein n=1 Tax=Coptis chinensis TaxID=261450 RepID=A0A835MEB8_9MAGN|nr:hypothetical protein IFM89_036102 [Coptis chinensis]
MALQVLHLNFLSTKISSSTPFPKQVPSQKSRNVEFTTSPHKCLATTQNGVVAQTERRSANYKDSIWEHDQFLKTLKNDYTAEEYVLRRMRANILKDEVTHILDPARDASSPFALLVLIDDIQRLGLGYIFEKNIRTALGFLIEKNLKMEESLETTALYFRLLRQHGFKVSQDVFSIFRDPQNSFKESLGQDVKGMVRLFEASYLGLEGEDILDEANAFARRHLLDVKGNADSNLAELVTHALDLPLHHRITRWWKKLDIVMNLPFSRDRLAESFLWSVGMTDEPQYSYCRQVITKVNALLTIIDDVYDVYATYDEAKLFTHAVERWDINAVEQLPDYMKLCFFALYNTVNEFAYNALKEHGFNILPHLRKQWVNQCKSYLLESKWFHTGYKATLAEYLDNACVSVGGPILSFHVYVSMTPRITKEALDYLQNYPDLIRWASMASRIVDDFGTSEDELPRGDVPKAIQCYMHDTGVSFQVAREQLRHLANEAWKRQNREQWVESPLPEAYVKAVTNGTRTAEIFYQYGDGFGIPDSETENRIRSSIVDPIPL